MRTDPNDQAYPLKVGRIISLGLTKRELFARDAMRSLLTRVNREAIDHNSPKSRREALERCSVEAVQSADALIEALNRTGNDPQ